MGISCVPYMYVSYKPDVTGINVNDSIPVQVTHTFHHIEPVCCSFVQAYCNSNYKYSSVKVKSRQYHNLSAIIMS